MSHSDNHPTDSSSTEPEPPITTSMTVDDLLDELDRNRDDDVDMEVIRASEDVVDHLMYIMGVDYLNDRQYETVMRFLHQRLGELAEAEQDQEK